MPEHAGGQRDYRNRQAMSLLVLAELRNQPIFMLRIHMDARHLLAIIQEAEHLGLTHMCRK